MRCLCIGGHSDSYIVTTGKAKTSTQKIVRNSIQNGAAKSAAGENREDTSATPQPPITNGVETIQTPTTVVQIHDNHNDEAARYKDTSKTVAKEFSSTPEGTLKKKHKAPQPKTSGDHVTSHKTSEVHVTFSESASIPVASHNTQSTYVTESSLHTSSHAAESSKLTHVPESPHVTQAPAITHSSHVIETTLVGQSPTVTNSSYVVEASHVTQPSIAAQSSHVTGSSHVMESSHVSATVTEESTKYSSSTIKSTKSETSLLTAPSLTNTISRPESITSIEDLTSSTAEMSLDSIENLANIRKESVGELLAGSNRSSASLEENVVRRRSGVQVSGPIGSEVTGEEELPIVKKSPEEEDKIKKAIEKNEFLSKILSGKRLQDIINAMQLRNVVAKQKLIKQGEKGSEMFVSKEGAFKILIKGKEVAQFSDTRVFGELAILYNAKRLASIQAVTPGKVWVLDRHVYQKIVISSNLKEQDENLRFLANVESLNVVDVEILRQVSNLLKPEFFVAGTVIIRQGDKGDKFYIIRAGTVTISKTGEGVLGQLGKGQCFGEMALQKEDTRQATVTAEAPGVECLTLTRADFINHFGDVDIPKIEVKKASFRDDAPSEYQDIKLEDLKIIKTLGVGGFGRVELVQHKKKKDLVFALKYLKKIDIVYQNQQEHVYNEKLIQMNSRSPFIVRLYRTYKDNKYVYFLMESCLGGDLFSLLHRQKGKRFEEKDARLLSACVLQALEHLHSKGVVYRDLKPENLLLDKNGYLKLTDFGFAKKMPTRGKTFTFAGTPEYVAPEIVLNRGHDKAVDYWAFGAFIFELLTGKTPFRTNDSSHMRTYNKILNGIDNANFPSYMNPKARNLIEKLCRPVPSERLGMQRGGTRDIKAHKWYQGFDWVKLQQCQIPSPFKPKLRDLTDTSNFDLFKQDKDYPPDETSGWDIHF